MTRSRKLGGVLAACLGCTAGAASLHRRSASASVQEAPEGPVAMARGGPIRGVYEEGNIIFKSIPYAEPPVRFEPPAEKRPWAPETLKATKWGSACTGAHVGIPESEDCLSLNIWVPKGGHADMPVIVYFHGGMNQHGAGSEQIRHGDGVVNSTKFPTIFINLDFRIGILGWLDAAEQAGVSQNLGLLDQQMALRWVHDNIAAFGGDPGRVTLMGQSEGSGNIVAHMVAPGSAGLFSRAVMHSPPADIWSRRASRERSLFVARRAGCMRRDNLNITQEVVDCMRRMDAAKLYGFDFVTEELIRNYFSPAWFAAQSAFFEFASTHIFSLMHLLGWHAVIDGKTLPDEPRELIRQGKWHKVPVLITVAKNESLSCAPDAGPVNMATVGSGTLAGWPNLEQLVSRYNQTLLDSGIVERDLSAFWHQVLTDKMWTCESRTLSNDILDGGAQAYLGVFAHAPKFDPVGKMTNLVCEHGATCHAADMMYILPQGRGVGIPATGWGLEEEYKFSARYRDEVLSFVHGGKFPWVKYDSVLQPMTFYDMKGPRVVQGYRKEQCDILDQLWGEQLAPFLKSHAVLALHESV